MPKISSIINTLLVFLAALYPFIVYFGLKHFSPRIVGILIFCLITLRILLMGKAKIARVSQAIIAPGIACLISFIVAISNQETLLLYNPVIISVTCLFLFAYTLIRPPSMIEKFARVQEPDPPPKATIYCRKVTIVWCIFFAVNAAIALYTIKLDDIETWTLYNGLISYLLMGAIFGIEYIIRQFVKRNN